MPIAHLANADIYYEIHGQGHPLLMLAPGGLLSHVELWRVTRDGKPRDYPDPIAALSTRYRCIAIDQRNRELQDTVVNLEQENLSLKHRNTRLEESLNQKQLYAGGFLVFAGFILHWLSGLFRLGQRRRSSFDDL